MTRLASAFAKGYPALTCLIAVGDGALPPIRMHRPMPRSRMCVRTMAMNAFNPLEATKRLQAAGIARRHAEAIASEINANTDDLVTKAYFGEKLDDFSEKLDARIEKLDGKINVALAKQTVRNGAITAGIVAAATSVLGLLISLQ